MSTFSIHDRIAGWVDDQLAKEDPLNGDEWGRHVTMALAQTPNGDAIIWVIFLTLRAPFLGLDPIGNAAKIQANIPPETAVRGVVSQQVKALRQEFARRRGDGMPLANGHPPNGLPPALRGKKVLPGEPDNHGDPGAAPRDHGPRSRRVDPLDPGPDR